MGSTQNPDGDLRTIFHPEGRVEPVSCCESNNHRIPFADREGDGKLHRLDVLPEHHNYPFGLEMEGEWSATQPTNGQRYRYNGKELNPDLGLYDYGARWYDPAVERFTTIDPLSEDYTPISPYAYVANNPLRYTDPYGSYIVDENGNKVTVDVNQDDDGNYSATFTDIDGNQIAADSDFGKNGGVIIGALLQTEKGREQLDKLKSSETAVTLAVSDEENVRENAEGKGVIRFAGTTIDEYSKNSDGKYSADAATLTVYKGSVERIANREKPFKSEKFNLMRQAGVTGSIGAAAGHEIDHAVDPVNVNMNLQNQLHGAKNDIEKGPKAITIQILKQAVKIKKQ